MGTQKTCAVFLLLLVGCTSNGYVYNSTTGSYGPDTRSACDRRIITSATIKALNSRIGQSGGPNAKIVNAWAQSKADMKQDYYDKSVSCEAGVLLLLADTTTAGGAIQVTYKDQVSFDGSPSQLASVSWKPDSEIRAEVLSERAAVQKAQDDDDEASGIHRTTVSDFDLDKRTLSKERKVIITGFYSKIDGIEQLTASRPLPSFNDGQPAIGLITDYAPRETRAKFQGCASGPIGGCQVTLIGHADNCDHLVMGQVVKSDICLFVDDSR